jgi:hypothetical protein
VDPPGLAPVGRVVLAPVGAVARAQPAPVVLGRAGAVARALAVLVVLVPVASVARARVVPVAREGPEGPVRGVPARVGGPTANAAHRKSAVVVVAVTWTSCSRT